MTKKMKMNFEFHCFQFLFVDFFLIQRKENNTKSVRHAKVSAVFEILLWCSICSRWGTKILWETFSAKQQTKVGKIGEEKREKSKKKKIQKGLQTKIDREKEEK